MNFSGTTGTLRSEAVSNGLVKNYRLHNPDAKKGTIYFMRAERVASAQLDRKFHERSHGVTVAEMTSLPVDAQMQLLEQMAEVFSSEFGAEDTRFRDPNLTFAELNLHLQNKDPWHSVITTFKKSTSGGRNRYELVATASMGRRDNPSFDETYFGLHGTPCLKLYDGWLMNVYTTKAHRGNGHSTHVIKEVASIIERRRYAGALPDFHGFHLYTKPENVPYYERLGFDVVGSGYVYQP